jgi:hypothetical protein
MSTEHIKNQYLQVWECGSVVECVPSTLGFESQQAKKKTHTHTLVPRTFKELLCIYEKNNRSNKDANMCFKKKNKYSKQHM